MGKIYRNLVMIPNPEKPAENIQSQTGQLDAEERELHRQEAVSSGSQETRSQRI